MHQIETVAVKRQLGILGIYLNVLFTSLTTISETFDYVSPFKIESTYL